MITGFNTDVVHEGRTYHVQTEDRGEAKPFLESLIYDGGVVIAKKSTSYKEELQQGMSEAAIATRLKKQHQVIIAAIRAGRIQDLIRLSANESAKSRLPVELPAAIVSEPPRRGNSGRLPKIESPIATLPPPVEPIRNGNSGKLPPLAEVRNGNSGKLPPLETPIIVLPPADAAEPNGVRLRTTGGLSAPRDSGKLGIGKSGSLNLDEVISDYLKRASEQEKLELQVVSPNVFTAGKSIALKVKVTRCEKHEADAIVTVKIIGTAFKPQVHIGRANAEGVASFSLNLPMFTTGTAAIVIEAQSSSGRGELKQLIRRG